MPNTAYQEVINGEKKTLKVATVSTLSKDGNGDNTDLGRRMRLAQVFTCLDVQLTVQRKLQTACTTSKLGEKMPYYRNGVTYLMMWFNGVRTVMPFSDSKKAESA